MVGETKSLTRAEIAAAISRQVGVSGREAICMVDAILERMTAALEQGENVKISRFGTFVLNDKAERLGRNPKTGAAAVVNARRVVTFNASGGLRARVAAADEPSESLATPDCSIATESAISGQR